EHALCRAFEQSPHVSRIFCAPGSAGLAAIAECVPIPAEDITGLADFASASDIGLTLVGGETALALGITDEFERRGLPIVGPTLAASRLESSKSFAKDFMRRHDIPTANYVVANSPAEAIESLTTGKFSGESGHVVIKADGLAAGKGVVIATDRNEAIDAVNGLASLVGAAASERIVIEEFLTGDEVSLLMFTDGNKYVLMPPTRDHKRIGDGETGPNTGGMGTFTDQNLLTAEQSREIVERIISPTLKGCRDEGFPYKGILFLGLMMTADGPKVLEYNVRFGDPETQSILVRLSSDIVDICRSILNGTLDPHAVKWRPGSSATVILAAEGYPNSPVKGDVILGIGKMSEVPDITIFHSGTAWNTEGNLVTAGGRVLGVTSVGDDLEQAVESAYEAAGQISWRGMQFRRDIGRRQ
ncbi:MAG: phosphoribosylamine--glycine ligase, partial [Acidobacteriota bacterium]